jgi:hypothetical protein
VNQLTFGNAADEVLLALTHGPTPGVQRWEIVESTYVDHKIYPNAIAILRINGHDFRVEVTALPDGE